MDVGITMRLWHLGTNGKDKFRMTAADIKCFKKTAMYTLLGHIRNQNILKKLPVMGTLTLPWRWSLNCKCCQGQRAFMVIVPLNAFTSLRCTEAESGWRTEGPYGAPRQIEIEPWTTTQVNGHNSFRERTDSSSSRLVWNINRQDDN